MIPSNKKLLLCMRRTMDAAFADIESKEKRAVLDAMDIVINELILRADGVFYIDHYRNGRVLFERGIRLGLGDFSEELGLPRLLVDYLDSMEVGRYLSNIGIALARQVDAVEEPSQTDFKDFLNAVSDWEIAFYQHRLQSAGGNDTEHQENRLNRVSIEKYLQQKFPDIAGLKIESFNVLYGGFSKATIMFSTSVPVMACQEFVIRADHAANIIVLDAGTVDKEYPVLSYAFEAGVPVAEPMWLELDTGKLGVPFMVSRRSKGENFGTATGASGSLPDPVLESLVSHLTKIHQIDLDPADNRVRQSHLGKWLDTGSLQENTTAYVRYWENILDDYVVISSPLIRRGINWVKQNIPDCGAEKASLLHGDYGLHNVLIDNASVSAILDWEVSRVGDPAEDLCWFISCMKGAASPEKLMTLYQKMGGCDVSPERLHFYSVFRCLQMLVVCHVALAKLESMGENISLGVIGIQMYPVFASKLRELIG